MKKYRKSYIVCKNYTDIFPGNACNCWIPEKCRYSFFIGISGIHDAPYVPGELEERADIFPIVFPVTDCIGIFLSPFFFYIFQLCKGGGFVWGIIYFLEIRGELLQIIIIHVFEGITQHMDHAPLNLSLGIYCLNCFLKAREAIHKEKQYVLHATVLQVIEHPKPELAGRISPH